MKARLVRNKASGQSLPLIALMIVVLIAMVGLAVDVGNTYAQQRNTVRSSNSAALAGMTVLINNGKDESVYTAIVQSLKSNNISVPAIGAQPTGDQREMVANYLDASGNPIAACPNVGGCSGTTMSTLGVTYIRVEVKGRVNTFFARVVNANSLPVGANAWAAKGACTRGIYPIVIRDDFLGPNGWVNPTSTYSDNVYKNRTLKRIYTRDTQNPNGAFNWLRWVDATSVGSAPDLQASLTGPGNIEDGFNEPAWPTAANLPPKPTGYPQQPGVLNAGDWVYGNSGISNSSGIRAELDKHMQNHTEMMLPLWDYNDGNGVNGNYHISRVGRFLLTGYDLDKGYFDFVYLGDGGLCATLTTNTGGNDSNVGVTGQVFFRPRYKTVPSSRPPVQYEIILDVSGSMSWKFDGYGYKNGSAVLCTGTTASCSGSAYAWPDQTLRRIYVAKQAIKAFIDQMSTGDTMRIVSFSGGAISPTGNNNAINQLTDVWPSQDWSSDKTVLKAAVDSAGSVNNNPYLTDGRTPSAAGIASGSAVFSSAPKQEPSPGTQTYKRVSIFLTDGVANIRRDGSAPTYSSGCGSEIATCNTGTVNGVALPITAMLNESDNIKKVIDTIYVIALAGVDETGLKQVASAPNYPYFSSSPTGSDLTGIFQNIATNVKYGDCVPDGGDSWETSMNEDQVGDVSPSQGGPLTYPVAGKVYLYDKNGTALPAPKNVVPIQIDPTTNRLSFHVDNMIPGTYQMRAFVAYRGTDDESRIYSQIYTPNTASVDNATTFQVDPTSSLGTSIAIPPVYLDLSGSVCPNP
jgi:Putative Flp pilus-assembly TadE/G-like